MDIEQQKIKIKDFILKTFGLDIEFSESYNLKIPMLSNFISYIDNLEICLCYLKLVLNHNYKALNYYFEFYCDFTIKRLDYTGIDKDDSTWDFVYNNCNKKKDAFDDDEELNNINLTNFLNDFLEGLSNLKYNKLNKKLSNEPIVENNFLDVVYNKLNEHTNIKLNIKPCIICKEITDGLYKCHLSDCKYNICVYCIQKNLDTNKKCCICREYIIDDD